MPMAEINGIRLHYHATGKGVPLVLIPPPLLTRGIFRYQTEALSDVFRVITFDVRGHGMSAPSAAPVAHPLIAEDVRQLLDHLGIERAFIGGYSTGAQVALEALLAYPDRFHGGIVLSGMSEISDVYNLTRLKLATAFCTVQRYKTLAYAVCRGNADSPETFANLFREALRGHPDNWQQYYAASGVYNCTGKLSRIHHPMLLVYGKKDHSFHRYARLLQRELLLSEWKVVRGVSHHLPTKAPRAVHRLIRDYAASVLLRAGSGTKREAMEPDWAAMAAQVAAESTETPEFPLPPG